MKINRILIAAPASGSGKSVLSAGIMAHFANALSVQGFKIGPDYIDPMVHAAATGRPAHNLDGWMLNDSTNRRIFFDAAKSAELSVVEGVMGLFDGYGADPFNGSTAAAAILLACPVVLVLDCAKLSGTAAAIVKGLASFDPRLRIAGVICNRVGSANHAAWLTEVIERYANVPVIGCVPQSETLKLPERHLGLVTVVEDPARAQRFIAETARLLCKYLDFPRMMEIAAAAPDFPEPKERIAEKSAPIVRIGAADDKAFCFYYADNLDALRRAGAEIVPFSPLTDRRLPDRIDGLYFGGGYPELYAERLAANQPLLNEIRALRQRDLPVYGECGGLVYLSEGLETADAFYPLAGVIPGRCRMSGRRAMGYRTIRVLKNNLLCEAGWTMRGHEFHYSEWDRGNGNAAPAYEIRPRSDNAPPGTDGWADRNLLASYIHLHFAQNPQLAKNFVQTCLKWSQKKNEL